VAVKAGGGRPPAQGAAPPGEALRCGSMAVASAGFGGLPQPHGDCGSPGVVRINWEGGAQPQPGNWLSVIGCSWRPIAVTDRSKVEPPSVSVGA